MDITEPKIIETKISFGGGGKVAIVDFGRITNDYFASVSRTWAVPPEWTQEQVAEFENAQYWAIRSELEPILQAEFDERYKQRNWD